jgi:hypothetical protein
MGCLALNELVVVAARRVAVGHHAGRRVFRLLQPPPNDTLDSRRFLGSRYFSIATDFARNGVAELVAQEILRNEVPGDVAELGVFEGDFAALLHSHLPERPIHLFDTFSGFAHRDVQTEMGASIPSLPDFSGTSIGEVLR